MTGAILGIGANLGMGMLNNIWAGDRAAQDREANFYLNEVAAEAAYKRQKALYKEFYSPQAQMKQIKEAGLSPSIYYGGTPGQGGMAAPQGNGANVQTPYMPMTLLEGAQIQKIMAETEKTKAETQQVAPMAESTIIKNLADAGHAEAAAAAAKADAEGTKLDNYVKEHTKDASVYTICELAEQQAHATEKMYHEMRSAKVLADIDEETYNTEVKKRSAELSSILQNIKTGKSQERLNEQQIKDLKDQILARIEETRIKYKTVDLKEKETTTYADYIEAQIPYIEEQIELKLKELGIANRKMWVDGISNIIRSIAIGAGAAAALKKGPSANPVFQDPGSPSLPYN